MADHHIDVESRAEPTDLVESLLFHYTDSSGYKAISSQPDWTLKAAEPPGGNPRGAYFTNLSPNTDRLVQRLRISREKAQYVFCFRDAGDLKSLRGGRGAYILYSEDDYIVETHRQVFHGESGDWLEHAS